MSDVMSGFRRDPRFEKHMYYRRPMKGEHKGWIVVAGSNGNRVEAKMKQGFEPLYKYGTIPDDAPGRWHHILSHPDGAKEFPSEQVLTFRWYRDPPIPGLKFPQLQGIKVKEYGCPECSHYPFQAVNGVGAIGELGRHLRIEHGWDRASIYKYGERTGIDFDAVYSAATNVVEFGAEEEAESIINCDECDWTPKPGAKRPDVARRLHKDAVHKPLEVETVG